MRRAAAFGLLPAVALAFAWAPPARAEKTQGKPLPMKIRFELPEGEQDARQPVPLWLVVESLGGKEGAPDDLKAVSAPETGIVRPVPNKVEFLLRLPAWVRVASPGWKEVPLPPEEKADASGPWKLFEKEIALAGPGAPEDLLARELLTLDVTEDGLNWVITARAKLISPAGKWQVFGTVFATRRGDRLELHATPRKE